jgi:methylthioribose-1-phosphate isomerase
MKRMKFKSIEWDNEKNTLRLLDQKKLPDELVYIDLQDECEIAAAIIDMTVRGAPAIGVAAAYGMVSAANRFDPSSGGDLVAHIQAADKVLRESRPTAVNLFWALERMKVAGDAALADRGDLAVLREAFLNMARKIEADDIEVNQAISRHAMDVVPDDATFFHHCNTGSLATVDLGTALGIIRTAHESGRKVMAYIDETRPRLQGAKLSSWELMQYGVKHAVVVDGASAHIMRTKHVDLCVVGCDRVAANGDTANKIGTYNLALAAQDNDVPFYVAAPSSTIDLGTETGDDIPIEDRDPEEITDINGVQITPNNAPAYNPAFDVTPNRLIAGIITEFGIARPPFSESLAALLKAGKKS